MLSTHWRVPHEPLEWEIRVLDMLARQAAELIERMRSEERLREERRRAEAASLAKTRFLAVMSHELRTPLSGMLGYVRLLEDQILGPLTPEQLEALARIRASASHQSELIEEVLTVSRIEAGKERVRWELATWPRSRARSWRCSSPSRNRAA